MSKSQSKNNPQPDKRVIYSEFGNSANSDAFERPIQDLPPNQQNLRVQATRRGRGGKTVTVISGFQSKPETLTALMKQLKAQCVVDAGHAVVSSGRDLRPRDGGGGTLRR